ncbi:MAG: FecR domain-containing protein [Pseudohongiella sp.]|nr:FecR domain-containing protein [Pseudohongiella sp.]
MIRRIRKAFKISPRHIECCFIYGLSILFALATPISFAQSSLESSAELAGHVIVASGDVRAEDANGSPRTLSRNSSIYVGDTIITAAAASTQIRMVDEALIALKESTEFAIVAYQYKKIPGTDVSTIQLIQGGFRTITGNIGKQNKQAYEARIGNLATIGIRGTDYEALITPAGEVLTGVYDGGTTVGNAAGVLDLGVDSNYDFAQIVDPGTPPEGLLFQPPGLGVIPQPVFDEPDADADNSAGNTNDNGADSNDGANDVDNSADATNTDSDNAAGNGPGNTASNDNDSTDSSSLEFETPAANLVAATARAGSVSELIRSDLQDSNSDVTVNSSETGNGIASCATDSSLCLQLADGGVSDGGADRGNSNNGISGISSNGNSGSNDTSTETDNGGTNTASGSDTDNNDTGNGNSANSGSGSSSSDDDHSKTITVINADNSTTTIHSNSKGSSTTTSRNGSEVTVVTDKDGDVVSTTTINPDGSSAKINFNEDGSTTRTTAKSNGSVSVKNSRSLSLPDLSIDTYDVTWGKWNNPVDENFVVMARIADTLTVVGAGDYLAQVNPSPIAMLKGSHNYATSIASSFLGSGSAGEIKSLIAAMDVNFDTGVINNGSLDVLAGDQTWSVNFGGLVQAGTVDLNVIQGQLFDPSGIISNRIGGDLGGVFTGNKADAFVGGFDLLDIINPLNSVDGLFIIER